MSGPMNLWNGGDNPSCGHRFIPVPPPPPQEVISGEQVGQYPTVRKFGRFLQRFGLFWLVLADGVSEVFQVRVYGCVHVSFLRVEG